MDRYFIIVCSIFLLTLGVARADSFESVDTLTNLSKAFIEKQVSLAPDESLEVVINPADIPNQLTTCSKAIELQLPKESIREKINSIELSCSGESPWHVFIPVNLQIYTNVLVALKAISPNETIGVEDVDFMKYNTAHLYNGYFKDKKELNGYVAVQMIASGAVLTKRNLKLQQIVHRNQVIDLVARKNAIVVTMKGIAKSDGALNDTISAFNPSSKKTVQAVVIGVNKAEVVSS